MSGLIVQVGLNILELACSQINLWLEQALTVPRISLNISVRQCSDEGFPGRMEKVLKKFGMQARIFDLEITESCFLDPKTSGQVFPALKALGLSLTIDDFGTGYATFASLQNAHVNTIKIDKSFVGAMVEKQESQAIVKAIVAIGNSHNLRTIAEGVETGEQFDLLREMGCDACQGYLIAKPMPASQFEDWLRENQVRIEKHHAESEIQI